MQKRLSGNNMASRNDKQWNRIRAGRLFWIIGLAAGIAAGTVVAVAVAEMSAAPESAAVSG